MYLDLISFFLGILSCFVIQKLFSIILSHNGAENSKSPQPTPRNDIAKETKSAEPVKNGEIGHSEKQKSSFFRRPTNVSSTLTSENRNVGSDDGVTVISPPRPSTLAQRPHPLNQVYDHPAVKGIEEKWEIIRKFRKPKEVGSYTFPYAPKVAGSENHKKENPKKENNNKNSENTTYEENGEGFQEMDDIQPSPKIENLENSGNSLTDSTSLSVEDDRLTDEQEEKEVYLSEGEDDRLTDEQEEKVKCMIEHLQKLQCPGVPPTRSEALKYLFSKNFAQVRASEVATAYAQQVWNKYGDIKISEIAPILRTGLIISPPNRQSKKNEQIIYIIPRNIDFLKDHPEERVKTVLYYLQRDLKSKVVQKNGFLLICDMDGAGMNPNIPSQKAMISLFQESIPAKARTILIVNGGLILRIAFESIKLLLSHKIQKRIQFLKHTSNLLDFIDKENLLSSLGGTLEYNHFAFIEEELEKEKLSPLK